MSENTSTSSLSTTTRPPPPLCPLLDDDEDYDTWVLAGGRLFRAHSSVLASHSAYLRGAAAEGGGGVRVAGGDVRLLLPHVPSAGFAAVLTYMYTGRLPLTPSTLYEVLLAGHVLQMASVVSLCQTLLTSASGGGRAGLGVGEIPPALSVWRGLARLVPPPHNNHTQPTSPTVSSAATVIRPTPTRPRPLVHPALNPPQELHRESELMDVDTSIRDDCNNTFIPHHPHHSHATSTPATTTPNGPISYQGGGQGRVGVGGTGAVVLDVATCDGPVFFERVVNRAYKANPLLSHDDSETETEINVDDTDSCDDSRPHETEGEGDQSASETVGMRGALEGGTATSTASPQPLPHSQTSRTYHCVYCNHTFKSHYCYQKHMRRHINPITVEVNKLKALQTDNPPETLTPGGTQEVPTGECGSSSNSNGAKTGNTSPYRNRGSLSPGLRILDLNVQYFPCKTCGSKFPSYYFVHKHRRLCHQDEERGCGVGEGSKKVNEPTPTVSMSPTTSNPIPTVNATSTVNTPSSTTSAPLSTVHTTSPTVSAPSPTISTPLLTVATPFPTISAPPPIVSAPPPIVSAPPALVSTPPPTSQQTPAHSPVNQHTYSPVNTLKTQSPVPAISMPLPSTTHCSASPIVTSTSLAHSNASPTLQTHSPTSTPPNPPVTNTSIPLPPVTTT